MFGNKNNNKLYDLISWSLIGQIILTQASDWLTITPGLSPG